MNANVELTVIGATSAAQSRKRAWKPAEPAE